jgi:dipeptidyl aminopeptidase/acylaminoacyl peptidase
MTVMARTFNLTIALLLLTGVILLGQIGERRPVELPPFESNRQIARYAEADEYAEAKTDTSFSYERVTYRSEGAVVSGYLYYNPKQAEGQKLPAIVFSRGSYIVNNQAPVLLTMIRRLAREGFVVFAPMFRGSDGMPGNDEMGGGDLQDLRSAIDVVKGLPGVDPENVFLYGESRGAMMTYFALREDWDFRAAAIFGGITELADYLKVVDPEGRMAATTFPDYASRKDEILRSRSAIYWPEKIRKPLLIMHGGDDGDVSPTHSLKMAEALTGLKREYSLVIFANDNHIIAHNRIGRDKLAVDWFRQHMAAHRPERD